MEISKLKTLLHERGKFYAYGYLFGYVVSIAYSGIPNILYLIPIKLICVICAIGIGTAFYYGSINMKVFEGTFRFMKYMVLIVGLIILSVILEYLLSKIGIDFTPFIGV